MPGKIKVQIVAGRNLPVMDRSSELTDAFVEVKFGSITYKTDVCRKSLNPHWNSEWYRFEVDDEDLQDEPLQIRVLDHDTYSSHDAIGKVYIDMDPLLSNRKANVISGWFPIYDTMHGIRGELNVTVKVELYTDSNKFRQSSCGVQFFCTSGVPSGFRIQNMHGFVEELVVNDDPEHQWIDMIRSMRASNEARQLQFSKLTGELQRRIGLKVLEMGGNSVIAYRQCFDLEGESGIIVRAVGTAVTLTKQWSLQQHNFPLSISPQCDSASPNKDTPVIAEDSGQTASPLTNTASVHAHSTSSPLKMEIASRKRRSSESDACTPPIGGSSFSGSTGSAGGSATKTQAKISQAPTIDQAEFPFFSMSSFPPGFISHLGAFVSAKSVKLLDKIHNPDEPETRDAWWTELRTEVRSHARSMGCHAVIGYYEQTSICDEIILLSACGTAAVLNLEINKGVGTSLEKELDKCGLKESGATIPLQAWERKLSSQVSQNAAVNPTELSKENVKKLSVDVNLANDLAARRNLTSESEEGNTFSCELCHIPYNEASLPFEVKLLKCAVCRSKRVPNVLFTTIEPPPEMPIIGKGCFIQARICRTKKDLKGETHAKEISDSLPFMEIELHSQLMHKLWLKGMNTLFGLRVTFCVGERLLVAVATATGVFSACLPSPTSPKIVGTNESKLSSRSSTLSTLQKRMTDEVSNNIDIYRLYPPDALSGVEHSPHSGASLSDEEETGGAEAELTAGGKNTFILQIDDAEDADVVSVLLDPAPPQGFDICNTEVMPGVSNTVCSLQTFTKVWRGNLSLTTNKAFSNVFNYLLRSLYFKLRKLAPCAVCHLDFDIDLPEEDEIQISITGTCTGLGDPRLLLTDNDNVPNNLGQNGHHSTKTDGQTECMMFDMEMVNTDTGAASAYNTPPKTTASNAQSTGANSQPSSISSPSSDAKSPQSPVHSRKSSVSSQLSRPRSGTFGERTRTSVSGHVRHSPVLCKGLASLKQDRKVKYHTFPTVSTGTELTPLSQVPGGHIDKYLGHLNFFIIRETTSLKEMGGLNGFIHSFIAEVMAICRAHVAALGGNALVSYQMSDCVVEENVQKNQSQCLVNVYGDVVRVLYGSELPTDFKSSQHQQYVFSQLSGAPADNMQVPMTAPPLMGNSPILKVKSSQSKESPRHFRQSYQN